MRKFQKLFLLFLFTAISLSSSAARRQFHFPAPTLRMVTCMEIRCADGQYSLERRYTHPEKLKPFLTYLRLLEYRGKAKVDPERLQGSHIEIVVYYADGAHRTYRQRANRYLSKASHPWEKIDPDQAKFLRPLLQAIPGDP